MYVFTQKYVCMCICVYVYVNIYSIHITLYALSYLSRTPAYSLSLRRQTPSAPPARAPSQRAASSGLLEPGTVTLEHSVHFLHQIPVSFGFSLGTL